MLREVLHTIHAYHLIPPLTTVLAAVSGGADSMALLHLLHHARQKLEFTLYVATLDHGLRGEVGAADAEFVRQLAESWGLPVIVGRAQVDPNQPGVETRAREARYAFLTRTATQIGATRIALAHHADDQAETVLMHLIRGGGIHGAAGMRYMSEISEPQRSIVPTRKDRKENAEDVLQSPPHQAGREAKRNFSGEETPSSHVPQPSTLALIRPLLGLTRAEIEAYCAEHTIPYRHDATNDEPNTLRNILRLQTLPHLCELNPHISAALNRFAETAAAEDEYLNTEIKRLTEAHLTYTDDRINVSLEIFRGLHLALKRRWLHQMLTQRLTGGESASFEHINAAIRLIDNPETRIGAIAEFPGGWRLRLDYQRLVLERNSIQFDEWGGKGFWLPANTDISVKIPGETLTPLGWRLLITPVDVPPDDEEAHQNTYLLIPNGAQVQLRTRHNGDRLAPAGMNGHERKLKEWLIDRKIPRIVRDRVPILIVNGILAGVLTNSLWHVTNPFRLRYNPVTNHPIYRIVTVAKI